MSAGAWSALLIGGALGAISRYSIDVAVYRRVPTSWPTGTFVVNVAGSVLLGVLTGLALHHGFAGAAKVGLATGFCGALTTFSTFSVECVRLFEEGDVRRALAVVVGGTVVCAIGASVGLALT